MAQQIQLRHDTAANWTLYNPVLAVGEIGVETNTDKFKIGDGVQNWTTRPYGGLVGPQGPQGAVGPQGPIGPQGPVGPAFVPGPQVANSVFAGPTSGADATPTFRALDYKDLPIGFIQKTVTNLNVPSDYYYITPSFKVSGTLKLEGNSTLKVI